MEILGLEESDYQPSINRETFKTVRWVQDTPPARKDSEEIPYEDSITFDPEGEGPTESTKQTQETPRKK